MCRISCFQDIFYRKSGNKKLNWEVILCVIGNVDDGRRIACCESVLRLQKSLMNCSKRKV